MSSISVLAFHPKIHINLSFPVFASFMIGLTVLSFNTCLHCCIRLIGVRVCVLKLCSCLTCFDDSFMDMTVHLLLS